jgi:hypothetical protein
MQTFELIQYIDSQPCSCIAFSNTQIIIGWHKFYQIDLQYSIDYNWYNNWYSETTKDVHGVNVNEVVAFPHSLF